MSKLDDILTRSTPQVAKIYKAQIKSLMLDLIGEDERVFSFEHGSDYELLKAGANILRENLRKRVKIL